MNDGRNIDPGTGSDEAVLGRQALAAHWEQARPSLFAYLTASIYDFHRAEDLLQEVAVAVAGQYHNYDPKRPFFTWAMGIARNLVLLHFRERARDQRHFSEATLKILAEAQRVEREASDKRDALRLCLRKISARRRQVLELRYTGGLSIAEIAQRISSSSNAVKIVLHRVRADLEECIRRQLAQENAAL